DIGNAGVAGESKTIRIGNANQSATYIAGISGVAVSGADVMGAATDRLMDLRPVTFKYKNDDQGLTQYGLVAEEVEKVYPELVVHDNEGKVETVRYSMLTSMLLNETQKLSAEVRRQKSENAKLAAEVASTRAELAHLHMSVEQRLATIEGTLADNRG